MQAILAIITTGTFRHKYLISTRRCAAAFLTFVVGGGHARQLDDAGTNVG
jgi:hypothetical protein